MAPAGRLDELRWSFAGAGLGGFAATAALATADLLCGIASGRPGLLFDGGPVPHLLTVALLVMLGGAFAALIGTAPLLAVRSLAAALPARWARDGVRCLGALAIGLVGAAITDTLRERGAIAPATLAWFGIAAVVSVGVGDRLRRKEGPSACAS